MKTQAELLQEISEGVKRMAPAIEQGIQNMQKAAQQMGVDMDTALRRLNAAAKSQRRLP